ncbi:uncharacterized protein ACN2A1_014920 [Glossina fuscipes fuscipes]
MVSELPIVNGEGPRDEPIPLIAVRNSKEPILAARFIAFIGARLMRPLAPVSVTNLLEANISLFSFFCRNWFKEIEVSRYNNREPHLQNAILRTFYRSAIVDGIICLVYIVLKSVISADLAQLLLQFERPSAIRNSSLLSNTTHRLIRSIVSTRGNNEDNVISVNKNEATTQIEEENWVFVKNFNEILHFVWNNGHWLVFSTLLGCFLIHHVDLRQRLLGARMHIACCSDYSRVLTRCTSNLRKHLSIDYSADKNKLFTQNSYSDIFDADADVST